jgi:hypothetical protein
MLPGYQASSTQLQSQYGIPPDPRALGLGAGIGFFGNFNNPVEYDPRVVQTVPTGTTDTTDSNRGFLGAPINPTPNFMSNPYNPFSGGGFGS